MRKVKKTDWKQFSRQQAKNILELEAKLRSKELDSKFYESVILAQRERLIRLTAIVDIARDVATHLRGMATVVPLTYELSGTAWMRVSSFKPVVSALRLLEKRLAAMEVDTAIPGAAKKS